MPPRILAAAVVATALLAACRRSAPELPEVRLFASADLPAEVARDAAARLGVARVTVVSGPDGAEVAWVSDPVAALALGARLSPGSAPVPAGVEARWTDPGGRFAPVAARARVLLISPAAGLPLEPASLRDLADPRLRGRIALVHPARGAGPVMLAALTITYGEESARRFLRVLAANGPRVVASDAEVRAAVASGAVAVGLAGSVDGAAGAASAHALRIVYPDQAGRGAVVLPTAVAVLTPSSGGAATEGAARLAAWLAGPEAERVLVARVPGLLPLRSDVPVPVGVEPAGNLASLTLDWDRLAAETARLVPILERWPEGAGGVQPSP